MAYNYYGRVPVGLPLFAVPSRHFSYQGSRFETPETYSTTRQGPKQQKHIQLRGSHRSMIYRWCLYEQIRPILSTVINTQTLPDFNSVTLTKPKAHVGKTRTLASVNLQAWVPQHVQTTLCWTLSFSWMKACKLGVQTPWFHIASQTLVLFVFDPTIHWFQVRNHAWLFNWFEFCVYDLGFNRLPVLIYESRGKGS